ncbi:uncharacterized protein LOC132204248 [Neocloeon triangulifer]|uniref:uncharacterized protein LOC132204248 n=1 Tax=Neocloeon triangulifer TaxID=2078957 RepID=UPI00286EC449|nr:uncharacterized protein LOC132204248 [Neocloeon triangulifer]
MRVKIGPVIVLFLLALLLAGAHAQFDEGEFLTNDAERSDNSEINIRKSASQLLNGFKSIFLSSQEENCALYGNKCSLHGDDPEFKQCCETLSCLWVLDRKELVCDCARGFMADDGHCFWPVYPDFMTVVVWLAVGLGLTIAISFFLVTCLKKKQTNGHLLNDLNYSTFGSPSSENEVHHFTSVLSPVATCQVIDRPPVYQMEDLPPSYEDTFVIKFHKS